MDVSKNCVALLPRGGGHFDIFGTGYVPLSRVSFSPFLLPSRVSFSVNMFPKGYTVSKSLPPDRTAMVILLPDRVFKLRMLSDRAKITAPQRRTPVHIRTKCPPVFCADLRIIIGVTVDDRR